MKRLRRPSSLLFLLLWLCALLAAPSTVAAPPPPDRRPSAPSVPGELLIGIKPNVLGVESAHAQTGAVVVQTIRSRHTIQRVKLPPTISVASAITQYQKDPRVLYA
ncbi:MAG: hypothetical protein LC737_05070, partial [Chloroflexi bacterium]|nr:hypothetical protein [Chloroflexota bacterium]